jgi:signal transduction histidine kinase
MVLYLEELFNLPASTLIWFMNNELTIAERSKSDNELARITALDRYKIEGSEHEEIFDHFVQMARLIFKVPAAIIAFVGEDAVQYKAAAGLPDTGSGKWYAAICARTIRVGEDIYITELRPQAAEPSSLAPADPVYTRYAGTPIITPDGYAIGCLGLLDHKLIAPGDEQRELLKIMATAVMDALEERLKSIKEIERSNWLSQTSQEGLWQWDIARDRLWWNSGFSMLFGYPPADETRYDLNFWCSRFEYGINTEVRAAMLSLSADGEYLFKKADDSLARVVIRSVVIKDELGRPQKIIGSILDISERFNKEEINRRANMELMRNKDEFISIASHEIKMPISIIKSYSQIIKKETEHESFNGSNLNLYAQRIQRQSEKLLELVENLLDIARINSEKMTIYPEMFDFVKLLDQIIDELDIGIRSHQIEKKGDTPLMVYADRFRVGQVLTNLITNAIKYSPGADRIIVSYYKNGRDNKATILIRDFGKGIAKRDQAQLFQKFQRIINMDKDSISGTGLGLSIAMEIIKQHGSIIKLDSDAGKGSVFSFDLPLSPAFNIHS